MTSSFVVTLDNFDGPLDFLLHLVQKNEIDIYEVMINKIIALYLSQEVARNDLDQGTDFISLAASLLLIKSKRLLPRQEQVPEEEAPDPRFDMIHHLLDYCRFREIAKELEEREQQQAGYFPRGAQPLPEVQKGLGIEHISLDDLAKLFQEIFQRAASQKKTIHEEVWRVSDKIIYLRNLVRKQQKVEFAVLFSPDHCREELIVTFLAILELMKLGELSVMKDSKTQMIWVMPHVE